MKHKKAFLFISLGVLALVTGVIANSTPLFRGTFTLTPSTAIPISSSPSISIITGPKTWYVDPTGGGTGAFVLDPIDLPTAVASASSLDTLILASGHYPLTAALPITKSFSMQGAGMDSTVIDCSLVSECFYITNANPTISDMSFENGAIAMYLGNDSSPSLKNLRFDGNDYGVYSMFGAPIIKNSTFQNNGYGVQTMVGGGGNPKQIIASTFDSNNYGINLFDPTNNELIASNTFTGNTRGLAIATTALNTNARVLKNEFSLNTYGLFLDANAWATTALTATNEVRFNSFSENTYGIAATGTFAFGGYQPISQQSIISSNTFNADTYAIHLSKSSNKVENNLIQDSVMGGIHSTTGDNFIAYNTIVSGGYKGLVFNTNDTSSVINNIFYDNAMYGIYCDSSSTGTSLGYNDSYGHSTADYCGTYVDLGGNVSVDPIFTSTSDFHLQSTSPLLNSAGIYRTPYDIEGSARDLLLGASKPEIGAYEY